MLEYVPEAKCFLTACPLAPQPVRPPRLLERPRLWVSAGRSVWVAVSAHQACTFTRANV